MKGPENHKPQSNPARPVQRISVCGKGGSGKSTVVALITDEFCARGRRVVIVDSDESNACLHWMLGLDSPPRPLVELIGGRDNVRRGLEEPEASEERAQVTVLARPQFTTADLPREYVVQSDGRTFVTVGKIHQALEGCACPLGLLSREFLRRLRLAANEMLIVDMEAGIEHFGRGIETSLDAVVVVVEPSLESVLLAGKVKRLAVESGAKFAGAVLNKVPSPEVEATLAAQLHGEGVRILGTLRNHPEVVRASLAGSRVPRCSHETAAIVDALLALPPLSP
jgi:CO dehydrogenase maturation factor